MSLLCVVKIKTAHEVIETNLTEQNEVGWIEIPKVYPTQSFGSFGTLRNPLYRFETIDNANKNDILVPYK